MPGHYDKPPKPPAPPDPKPPKLKPRKPPAPQNPFDEKNTEDDAGKPVKGSGHRSGLDTTKWGH